jgi:hypothetical protein
MARPRRILNLEPIPPLLSRAEAARVYNLPKDSIDTLIKQGLLRPLTVNSRVIRVRRAELEALVNGGVE